MEKTYAEQGSWRVDEGVEEGRPGEEATSEQHHALPPQEIGQRAGGELDDDAGHRRGCDDQPEERRRGPQVLGEPR